MTMPSDIARETDKQRHYSHDVDVWWCRECGEIYDYLPRVKEVVECSCGATRAYIESKRISD